VSKILRRPMFRGGRVSSYGTGIANGLTNDTPGYKEGGQIGGGAIYGKPMGDRYGFAEPTIDSKKDKKQKIIEQVLIEFPDATIEEQMKIAGDRLGSEEGFLDNSGIGSVLKFGGNLGLDIGSSIIDPLLVGVNTLGRTVGYNPGLSANKGVEFIKEGIFGDNAEIYDENDPDKDPDANPDVAEFFGINTNAENTGDRRERDAKELLKITRKQQEKKLLAQQKKEQDNRINKNIEGIYDQKSDTDVMKEYMDMFSEAYGTDKEALNRSRYLELAKFGANILAQPGGQTIGEVLGQAGGPALEGMTKIEEAENQGQRQLKGIALQAAMKSMDKPYLDKIMTMSQLTGKPGQSGYKSPADIINLEFKNASDGRNKLESQKINMAAFESESVESPLSATQQLQNAGLQYSDIEIIKDFKSNTGEFIEDSYYVAQKPSGKNYLAKWAGSKFLFPNDDGF